MNSAGPGRDGPIPHADSGAPRDGRVNLLDFTLPRLTQWMGAELGEPAYRAVQVWQWVWRGMARDFAVMSNVSKACRGRLAERARLDWPETVETQQSADGTVKFLLRLEDGAHVESVLIPSEGRDGGRRWSQCLSSQVGCPMGCAFCATGSLGFRRNLRLGELLGRCWWPASGLAMPGPTGPCCATSSSWAWANPCSTGPRCARPLKASMTTGDSTFLRGG